LHSAQGKSCSAARHTIRGAMLCLVLITTPVVADSGWDYGKRGLEWSNAQTGSYLWLGLRAQARYTSTEQALTVPSEYRDPAGSDSSINRGRYKIGAGYSEDLTFYHEYDLVNSRLLDLRSTWIEHPEFNVRLGQWKADYNRERVDSSGKQQFVERSIATYWFTIDRQWGAMASGRIGKGARYDSNWWAGVLAGDGLNTDGDGGRPMLMGRWQWNYTGYVLPFSQSALKRYLEPHASLAFAAVTNDSHYTRFSSDGGGQLPGYEEGRANQYRVWQAMQEWAWQQSGLSFQQELHFKSIEDRVNGGTRNLYGGYAQVGWFPSDRWHTFSDKLEVALRGAYVNSNSDENLENRQFTLALNWFVNGHRNKFTADLSYVEAADDMETGSDYRFQLQWDLSI
jgi:phosphate-selective porin OprO/OprP